VSQLALSTEEERSYLAAWINEPDPGAPPRFIEGDGREVLKRFPADSFDFEGTSPPYPRAQRKPEDLGRYRRFVDDSGSLLPGANDIPRVHTAARKLHQQGYRDEDFQEENRRRKREQYALEKGDDHPNGLMSQTDRAAMARRREELAGEHADAPRGRRERDLAARQADLLDAGRSPHARKKLEREGLRSPHRDAREGFKHGKPNLKGETGLSVQLTPAEWWPWFRPFAVELLRVLKPRRSLLLNVGGVVSESWHHSTYDWDLPRQMESLGWKFIRPIYWVKPNGPPCTAEGSMTNVVEHIFWFAKGTSPDVGPEWFPWELHQTKVGTPTKRPIVRNVFDFPVGQTRWPEGQAHFACFPSAMAERMVRGWSAPGELVLDPFSGSGTLPLAACRQGRRWVGIDLNPEGELDCARARWEMEFGGERGND